MPTEHLTEQEWMPGEHLNGLECLKVWHFVRYEISDLLQNHIINSLTTNDANMPLWTLHKLMGIYMEH